MEPMSSVAEPVDLVFDLGLFDGLIARVARMPLTVATRGLYRLLPR